jgi:uncharacterized damage-inducible protein DinB
MTPTELYAYHRWANRRLFDVAGALGEETCGRDIGKQFSFPTLRRMLAHLYGADALSFPTLRRMLAHLYGADALWLARWKGQPTGVLSGADIASMAALRKDWDALVAEQQAWVEALKPVDLGREVHYKDTAGNAYHTPLGILLAHVAAHGNHHRSEVATMLTMVSGSPPDTGIVSWHRTVTGQLRQ